MFTRDAIDYDVLDAPQPGCLRISASARHRRSYIESRVFAIQVAALLRRAGDLVLKVTRLMIAAKLAQRRFV